MKLIHARFIICIMVIGCALPIPSLADAPESLISTVLAEAKKTAKSLGDRFDQQEQLIQIAVTEAELGRNEDALATINEISEFIWLHPAVQRLAHIRVKAGDSEGALQVVRRLKMGADRANALIDIAVARKEIGDEDGAKQSFQEALRNALKEFRPINRDVALMDLAIIQAEAGYLAFIEEIIAEIEQDQLAVSAWLGVSIAHGEAGDNKSALTASKRAIKKLQSTDYRFDTVEKAKLFAQIAMAQTKFADRKLVDESLSTALAIARAPEWKNLKEFSLFEICDVLIKGGEINTAVTLAKEIPDKGQSAAILSAAAIMYASSGKNEKAQSVLDLVLAAGPDSSTNNAVAGTQAYLGDTVAALATADAIEDPHLRALSRLSIADAQVKAGRLEDAAQIALSIETAQIRGLVFGSVIGHLVKAGNSDALLRVNELASVPERVAAYLSIVRILVHRAKK